MNIQKDYVKKAVEELGFKTFTEVQEKVIPIVRRGLDLIGCSQTGSGKTHAFLIPIFERLNLSSDTLDVVITSPTRELANQIYQFARQIALQADQPIDIRLYTGGSNRQKEDYDLFQFYQVNHTFLFLTNSLLHNNVQIFIGHPNDGFSRYEIECYFSIEK